MKPEMNITGNRLQIGCVFNAPRMEVFSWWTQAEKLERWSGCKEATHCEVTMDFRVGGCITQKMKIVVNGRACDFTLVGTYEEIVEPERISYRAGLGQSITQITVEFFDEGNQTRVVLIQDGFADMGSCKIVSQGTLESFDKLDSILAGQVAANPR